MKAAIRKLWHGDDGFIVSTELILVATILVLGLVAGLSAVSSAVNLELGDVAQAISHLKQSYSYGGVSGAHGVSGGTVSIDLADSQDCVNCVQTCSFNAGTLLPGS